MTEHLELRFSVQTLAAMKHGNRHAMTTGRLPSTPQDKLVRVTFGIFGGDAVVSIRELECPPEEPCDRDE